MDKRSEHNLVGVHPALVGVVRRAAEILAERADTGLGFVITEGLRTPGRQAQLVKAGASQTLASRHLTGHAVDVAATLDGQIHWDWPLYIQIADVMKAAADGLGVQIVWGGDWHSLRDGPHFELSRNMYSA